MTRAKNFLIICGEPDVLANGLAKTDDLMRLTSLKARLDPSTIPTAEVVEITEQSKDEQNNEQAKEKKQHTTEQRGLLNVTESHKIGELLPNHLTNETAPYIHPLIGMEGVSPYDFND